MDGVDTGQGMANSDQVMVTAEEIPGSGDSRVMGRAGGIPTRPHGCSSCSMSGRWLGQSWTLVPSSCWCGDSLQKMKLEEVGAWQT